MKLLMFIILFVLVGAFFIFSNERIQLNSPENISLFLDKYGHWIDKLAGNSKTAIGYVVKMEWLPDEGQAF